MLIKQAALLKNPPEASHFKLDTIPTPHGDLRRPPSSGPAYPSGRTSRNAPSHSQWPSTCPCPPAWLLSGGTATGHSLCLEHFYPDLCMAAAFPHWALNDNVTSSERPCLTITAEEAPIPTLLVMCHTFNNYLLTGGHAFKSVTNCIHGQKDYDSLVGNSIYHTLCVMLLSLELIASPHSQFAK